MGYINRYSSEEEKGKKGQFLIHVDTAHGLAWSGLIHEVGHSQYKATPLYINFV